MLASGRSDFSAEILRLVSDPDSQVHLRALRAGRRFRPSVLGPSARQRLTSLPDDVRADVLAEIAGRSGMDGIELAAELATEDTCAAVKIAVIEALLFRRADQATFKVLQSAPDEVWKSIARKGYASEVADPASAERLQTEERILGEEEKNPVQRLLAYQNRRGEPIGMSASAVREVIEQSTFR